MQALLDFVIRNQSVLFGVLGVLITLASITAWLIGRRRASDLEHYQEGLAVEENQGLGLLQPDLLEGPALTRKKIWAHLPWLAAAASILLTLFVIRAKPIPKTVGLAIPELTLDHSKPNLIIFVHGWRGDSDGTWLRFPDLIRSDPRFKDTAVVAVDYPIFIARRNLTLGETASWLAENLESKGVSQYGKIAIIAHSIGGLVSRKLLLQRRHGFRSVGLLVEVATPHLGTERYAQLLDDLGVPIPGNDIVAEVRKGSDWLRELRNDWNALEPQVPTQCFTSPNDNLVPEDSAIFQCERFHFLPGFGHTAMVKPDDANDIRYSEPTQEVDAFLHPPPGA